MKRILQALLIVNLLSVSLFAYKFLGPKWPGRNPVVPYWFNEKGCEDVTNEWPALHSAFNQWCDVPTTAIDCEYKGMTTVNKVAPDTVNIVKWAEGNDWKLGRNILAVAYIWKNKVNTITDFDIVFNGKNWKWRNKEYKCHYDITSVALHEVGHALGMDHSEVKESVMWPVFRPDNTTKRKLFSDDSCGITALYPRTNINNRPPVFVSTPKTDAIAGMRYNYQAKAVDPDGDSLTYSLKIKPLNMRIDSITGLITWFPKFLDLKVHDITVVATDELGKTAEQKYKLNVTNLVVYTVDDTVKMGDTLYYNVYVSPMDEYGVLAGNIELGYNNQEMVILEVDTVGSVIAGASYAKNITDDMIKFAFAGADPFSGGGILFRIKMLIFDEHCGKALTLPIVKAFFNDGDPVATTKDGTVFMPCGGDGYQIDGKILYCGNNMGVGQAFVDLVELSMRDTTTEDGFFAFTKVPRSCLPYTVHAEKDSGDIRDAITAYDASLILRYVVGLHSLTTFCNQDKSADVNTNDMLTAYDAALILRFIVEYNDGTSIGKWVMVPADTTLKKVTESIHNIIINAYMIGDVSGNWNDWDGTQTKNRPTPQVAKVYKAPFVPCDLTTESGTVKGYKTSLSIKEIAATVYAGEFELSFNSERYAVHQIKPGALLNGFLSMSNVKDNRILIAFAGTDPFITDGTLYDIELIPDGGFIPNDTSLEAMTFKRCLVNETGDQQVSINNPINMINNQGITRITSVYPNPFKNSVAIEYSIESKQEITIGVYDLKGREIVSLVNTKRAPGTYKIFWDGKDKQGRNLGAQIYLLRFQSGNTIKNTKLYKIW